MIWKQIVSATLLVLYFTITFWWVYILSQAHLHFWVHVHVLKLTSFNFHCGKTKLKVCADQGSNPSRSWQYISLIILEINWSAGNWYMWFKYFSEVPCTPKFNLTGIWTHDDYLRTVHFISLRCLIKLLGHYWLECFIWGRQLIIFFMKYFTSLFMPSPTRKSQHSFYSSLLHVVLKSCKYNLYNKNKWSNLYAQSII